MSSGKARRAIVTGLDGAISGFISKFRKLPTVNLTKKRIPPTVSSHPNYTNQFDRYQAEAAKFCLDE